MESGRKVRRIWYNGANGDESLVPAIKQRMVTLSEHHGEYDLDWVCIIDEFGKEISRHNARFIASIEWA